MKRFVYCLFLFVGVSFLCLGAGVWVTRTSSEQKDRQEKIMEQETLPPDRAVINQTEVEHISTAEDPPYCLVSEDGFLLVFRKNQTDVCLYTHIPIADFPKEEQDKLRQGIWFATMLEVYSYLESYTS